MDRRTFITLLSAGAIGNLALDPEKLLWVPGAKKIFIPPPCDADMLRLLDAKMREAVVAMRQCLREFLFTPDPVLEYFKSRDIATYEGGSTIEVPFTYKTYGVNIRVQP